MGKIQDEESRSWRINPHWRELGERFADKLEILKKWNPDQQEPGVSPSFYRMNGYDRY